jgi:ribose-phosphate pyrophosphokinase
MRGLVSGQSARRPVAGSSTIPAPLILGLEESRALAAAVAECSGVAQSPVEERDFEAGEFKLRPLESMRDRTVFIVQSLCGSGGRTPSERLVRLLFLALGLRDVGAARVIAVIPYLAFARKDRRTQPRDPVSSRYVAELIEAARIDRVIALDVHNPAAFDNSFRIGADHLSARPFFVEHFVRVLAPGAPVVVVSPDVGGIKRAQLLREQLASRLTRDVELAFVEKRRARGHVSGGMVCGDVAGRTVVVVDDLCASGGTLIRAATALRAGGARGVHVAFTHAPCGAGVAALGEAADIDSVVLTDSIPLPESLMAPQRTKFAVLPIAPLLGETVARMVTHQPVSELLVRFPPDEEPY